MSRIWTRGFSFALVALLALVVVADVSAGHRRRRRGCGGGCGGGCGDYGYAPGYYGTQGTYGKGGYGHMGNGYNGGYAGYAPGNGGAAYAPAPGTAAVTTFNQPGVVGTANADVSASDRSARLEGNANVGVRSNSDVRTIQPQANLNSDPPASANANLPATPTVAP